MLRPDLSIRLRLIFAALVSILVAMLVAGWGFVLLFEHHVERRVVAALETDLRQLIGGLSVGVDGTVVLQRRPADPRYAQPFSGTYWQVQAGDTVVERSRSLWDETLILPADDPATDLHEHVIAGPRGQPLIAVERAVRAERASGSVSIRFAVAQDRAETISAVQSFRREITVMLGLLGVLLLTVFAIAVTVGLSPLRRLRAGLADLHSGETQRVTGRYPAEVALLVDDLNKLLDARDKVAEKNRQRAADLAHGLKTPVAAILAIAEDLKATGQVDLSRELGNYAESMLRHVERELARSRSIATGVTAAATPLKPLVAAIVRSLERLPRGRDLAWDVEVPEGLQPRIDPTALAEIFGGLLDNARKWARHRVTVRAQRENDAICVMITDDGPGVAATELLGLTARGKRLDEKKPGSGLGLAIASDILEEIGGSLHLANAPEGGLAATVRLPVR
jgi:signal transduction histidine kinase